MRPVVQVVETDAGYVVVAKGRRSARTPSLAQAIAEAERAAGGTPVVWGPGSVPDTDVILEAYPMPAAMERASA